MSGIMLFLDTEFCESSGSATLLSLGIVAADAEFYAEMQDLEHPRFSGARGHEFLRENVLPQLGLIPGAQQSAEKFAEELTSWLNGQAARPLEVAYDYSQDFNLLEQLLTLSATSLVAELVPVHVGYLLEDADGEAAALASWEDTARTRGLKRHHALADALALRARFFAVHGS